MTSTRFIWKIENFGCLDNGLFHSPSFSSHSETWEVVVYIPSRNAPEDNTSFSLRRKTPLESSPKTFFCSLAFLDFQGSPLLWREGKINSSYFQVFSIRQNQIRLMKEKLLTNDILTVECRIWETDYELNQVKSFFARTHVEPNLEVIEKTFVLKTIGVNSLLPNQKKEHEHLLTRHGDKVKILLYFNNKEEIQAEITISLLKTLCKCKISLLYAMGKHIQVADGEFDFDSKGKKWLLTTQITRSMLRCNQIMFLPNDTLTLVFAFTFSCKVTFSRSVTENEMNNYNPHSPMNEPILTPATLESNELGKTSNELEPSNRSEPLVTINQIIQSMYENGYMSDFSLRVEDRTFPVHKAILGARSSVFDVMFTADMKEKATGSVDIPDVDADTIQRMLKFIYCDAIQEDMKWEKAASLYAAADKYAIEILKQRCSNILKSELCASNVLGILVLSSTYLDQNLETAALEFIARNDKLIIGTDPWCKFEKDYPQLAFDAFRKLYIRKMNG